MRRRVSVRRLAVLALVGSAAVAAGAGCGGLEGTYRKCIKADSTPEYRRFLAKYGTSELAPEISARLEDRVYRDVKEARTAAKFGPPAVLEMARAYLAEWPDGKRVKLVEKIHDEVLEEIRTVKLCPVPLLDDFEGGSERVGTLATSGEIDLTPGDLRFAALTVDASDPGHEVVGGEVAIDTMPVLPPAELFIAQIKNGRIVVIGLEVPRVAATGTWRMSGKVRLVTAAAAAAAEAKKAGGEIVPAETTDVPFTVEVKVGLPPPPPDARDAATFGGAWELYRRKAGVRETERDTNGYCRSSKPEMLRRCRELTAEAELLRRAATRAVVALRAVREGADEKARAVADDFFAKHPEAAAAAP